MRKFICVNFLDTHVTYSEDTQEYYNLLGFLTAAEFDFEVEFWEEDYNEKEKSE